ncbi:ABC transporter substrate-binding protein [Shewanella sp. SNU WT4]|uniref:ABC transporter substrate-binding protein n=1 Tax=Shewanella sp. SNU WT4 TaxID=2590015 RepID=UPI00143CD22B|nr:ABC transporter substrate-binding protein [Shewanella sp. SNU WT4]
MPVTSSKFIWITIGFYWLISSIAQADPIKIAVSLSPLSTPVIIAKQQGFFTQYGVDVELLTTIGGNACLERLLNNEVDLATTSDSAIMFMSFSRQDFRVLANISSSDNDIKLYTQDNSGIHAPKDLINKNVGIVKHSASEYLIDQLLLLHGLESSQIKRRYYSADKLANALLTGEVDAVSIWEPYGYRLQANNPSVRLAFDTQVLSLLSFSLVTQEKLANSLQWPAILQAINAANLFILSNEAESQRVVQAFLGVDAKELTSLWPDYRFRLSSSEFLLAQLKNSAHWALTTGIVSSTIMPDFDQIIHSQALDTQRLITDEL